MKSTSSCQVEVRSFGSSKFNDTSVTGSDLSLIILWHGPTVQKNKTSNYDALNRTL